MVNGSLERPALTGMQQQEQYIPSFVEVLS
jgi:hypothetical protein